MTFALLREKSYIFFSCLGLTTRPLGSLHDIHIEGMSFDQGSGENRRNFIANCSFSGIGVPCQDFTTMITDQVCKIQNTILLSIIHFEMYSLFFSQGICYSFNAKPIAELYRHTEYFHLFRQNLVPPMQSKKMIQE